MIEVNRNLYMDEKAGTKSSGFEPVKGRIQAILKELRHHSKGTGDRGVGTRVTSRQLTT
jgi:N-formylglutamate amidohydrolase